VCGFGVTNLSGLIAVNDRCQRRGPDATHVANIQGLEFLHNHLHITGDVVAQPFVKGDVACVFNGEIYNYQQFGSYSSDGECIIDLYTQLGPRFVSKLDGEFAICVVDFAKNHIVLATDTFACKPLWYEFDHDKFGIASYQSQLTGLGFDHAQKLSANTTLVVDLATGQILEKITNVDFDLDQHKETFDDWIRAFELSIAKRTRNTNKGMFIGLSSGYDSGAIACELNRQGVAFKAYSIVNNENMTVLQARIDRVKATEQITLSKDEYQHWKQELAACEDFEYQDHFKRYNIKQDQASQGLAAICSRARKEGRRIYFSGQGADEIISDYGHGGRKIFKHSGFGGLFPDRLEGFWPWHSFYDGTQIQYLNKEEYIAGHFGIETRYPFLDRDLVQEFLWLSARLKNSRYKSALDAYLQVNTWPYQVNEKLGFHVISRTNTT
jgi:asparagine synthetase B (glutamine-hydrolysing)